MSAMGDADGKKFPITADITLDYDGYEDGAHGILQKVRPAWKKDSIAVKIFTNGITNKMLGYYHAGDKSDIVLIRINGNKTEIFLDRENEVESFKTLHDAGRAPNLYCIFNNGLCYEYIQGETATKEEVRDSKVFELIAEEMTKQHMVRRQNSANCESAVTFAMPKKFLHLRFSPDAPAGKGLNGYQGPLEDELRRELKLLEEHLSELGSPLVYCHNDLLLNNIVYNKGKNSVHFIDYEYTGMNYQAFDIANHFCEFAGVDEIDYSLYPDKDLQCAWIKHYLKCWNKGSDVVATDYDVEKLYVQVNKFALASHFLWGTWALVQAKYSSIDFDYLQYAQERFGEYFRRKEEFLALSMP